MHVFRIYGFEMLIVFNLNGLLKKHVDFRAIIIVVFSFFNFMGHY